MNRITEREKEILRILRNNPMIAQEDLADMVGITRSAVAVHISNLIRKGYILGRGYVFNDKTGVLVLGSLFVEVEAVIGGESGDSAVIEIGPGGSAYLIANHLAAQNVPSSVISVLGRDDWGGIIGEKLKMNGIDTRHIIIQRERPTPRRIHMVDNYGNEHRILSDMKALETMDKENLPNLSAAVANCRMLVIETGISWDTCKYALELAKEARVPACARFVHKQAGQFSKEDLAGLFLAVMAKPMAEELTGKRIRDLTEATSAARLINELGIELVVTVINELGVALTTKNEAVTVPVMPLQERKNGLSVDALTAGLVSGILRGYDYRQSVRLGLRMAAYGNGKLRNMSLRQEMI